MSKRSYRERECIHREEGAEGDFYKGLRYIKAIQHLPSDEAVKMARLVEPFYWSDAENIVVWLCNGCAKSLRLMESPPTFTSNTQQPTRGANSS